MIETFAKCLLHFITWINNKIYHILSLTFQLIFTHSTLQQAYNAIAVSRQMKLLALASSQRNNSNSNTKPSESSCESKTIESTEVSASE